MEKTLETLLRNADTATYRAKQDGRNNFRFFTREMQSVQDAIWNWLTRFGMRLNANQFHVSPPTANKAPADARRLVTGC